MRCSDLRVRILAVIGATGLASAAITACGSDPSPIGSHAQDDAADERGDAGGGLFTDAAPDSAQPDTSGQDGAGDERPPSPRRPFLVGASLRSAASEVRDDWVLRDPENSRDSRSGLDAATARELARVWLADGLEEHASIAAFARFTMMLLAVGAPPDLVVASQRASIDEIGHARECFALAHRYGGGSAVGPGKLDVHDALGAFTLADLAALATEEGCIGETLGVALANEQLALVTDPHASRVLTRIVKDEARHAELAWRFVAWAIGEEQRGSPSASGVSAAVGRAAAHAIAATRAMTIRPGPNDLAAWHTHGRLTCAEARDASERAVQEVVLPCLGALLGEGRGPQASGLSPETRVERADQTPGVGSPSRPLSA